MISTKLGLHVIGGTSLNLGHPRLIKLVDVSTEYVREVRALVGLDCLIIVRWVESGLLDSAADSWFYRHFAQMQAMAAGDHNICFEGPNEIADSDAPRYSVWELARMRLMHTAGLRSVVGNWSVGTPDLPAWKWYGPLLAEMRPGVDGDLVGLHEYWVDYADISNRWHCGRWTLVPELAGKQIVVTECGRDVVEGHGKAGWQLTCDAATYLADLRAYSRLLDSYPNVLGAAVYQVGAISQQWKPFDVTPIWPQVIDEYPQEVTVPETTIKLIYPIRGPVFITQEFGEHAVNYAPYPGHPGQDLRAEIGHPVRAAHDGIIYHDDSYGPAFGLYCWVKGTSSDGRRFWTMYNHLDRVLADDREEVRAGSIIALSGNSGTSTSGAHLDWRIETTVPNPGYQDFLDKRYYWCDVRQFLG